MLHIKDAAHFPLLNRRKALKSHSSALTKDQRQSHSKIMEGSRQNYSRCVFYSVWLVGIQSQGCCAANFGCAKSTEHRSLFRNKLMFTLTKMQFREWLLLV